MGTRVGHDTHLSVHRNSCSVAVEQEHVHPHTISLRPCSCSAAPLLCGSSADVAARALCSLRSRCCCALKKNMESIALQLTRSLTPCGHSCRGACCSALSSTALPSLRSWLRSLVLSARCARSARRCCGRLHQRLAGASPTARPAPTRRPELLVEDSNDVRTAARRLRLCRCPASLDLGSAGTTRRKRSSA